MDTLVNLIHTVPLQSTEPLRSSKSVSRTLQLEVRRMEYGLLLTRTSTYP